ncbi:MAG: hypothetical protein EA406_13170 [Rhodospirillales bacterium]|nr:MAG: hypothetical protein EA406_13170 [Rhodospirillales bacterium]
MSFHSVGAVAMSVALSVAAVGPAQARRASDELLRNTASGAAKGAIGAAIAGDAGKDAAAGAVGGLLSGEARRRR